MPKQVIRLEINVDKHGNYMGGNWSKPGKMSDAQALNYLCRLTAIVSKLVLEEKNDQPQPLPIRPAVQATGESKIFVQDGATPQPKLFN